MGPGETYPRRRTPPPLGSRLRALVRAAAGSVLLAAATMGGAACGDSPTQVDDGATAILFIGNSHTAFHNVPALVRGMAAAAGRPVYVEAAIIPGSAIIDHWNGGRAREMLASRRWDFVVMQQGPSTLLESREVLIAGVEQWAPAIRAQGATPALYGVWPEDSRRSAFPAGILSYRLAAQAVNGRSLPAAGAWLAAWSRDPSLSFYDLDGSHANADGAWLAAMVITAGLLDVPPSLIPARITGHGGADVRVDEARHAIYIAAAAEALLGLDSPDVPR